MPADGTAQDLAARKKWFERVSAKHKINRFKPPSATCRCGGWSICAPIDMQHWRQIDFILDSFGDHRRSMSAELKKLRAEKRADK